MFYYRTYSQAHADMRQWSRHLPPLSAVAGVPRSGTIVAAMLSELRGIPLLPIEALMGHHPCYRPDCSRPLQNVTGPILVLDDTCCRGRTIPRVRQKILPGHDVIFGALWAFPQMLQQGIVDVAGYELTTPHHAFEWNLLHDGISQHILVDMDGVLCDDWYGGPLTSDADEAGYVQWLSAVSPLRLPQSRIRGIVTGRLEKYRQQTEAWLAKHGVVYDTLRMHPTVAEEQRDPVGFKISQYRELAGRTSVYIESCPRQAAAIALAATKEQPHKWPVLCFSTGELHNPMPSPPFFAGP